MINQFSNAASAVQKGMPNAAVLDEEAELAREGEDEESGRGNPDHDKLLKRLHEWLTHEKDRQAENRYQMALDGEYYDGNQWLEDDAREVEARGQAPLTFNEVAVSINWIAGSEKRNRVDWRVLPRTEDDQGGAETKTKVMKYISDVNNVPFVRSAAFLESAISGLSWIEDSLSTDGTDDILYCGHQSWRTAYHDSYHLRPDGRDMRYFFRWKTLDVDVAKAMFPGHEAALERACKGSTLIDADDDDELWYLGTPLSDKNRSTFGRRTYLASTVQAAFSQRDRVKVWEAWYREPKQVEIVRGGQFDGELYDPSNQSMAAEVEGGGAYVQPAVIMRVHCAFFVEDEILEAYESPFKHNDFPFTPVYCYRRQRDGMPYGFVRNMRDAQDDLNKRMSKSLFLLSVNQLITESGAFDDNGEYTLQDAIDNVSNPAGVFVMKDGTKRFEIRRDYADQDKQLAHVQMNRSFLQSTSGVTDELLGRRTNATSGKAIEARQDQGSLATSGIFDHYRLAIRLSGQKQLSNAEKFYSMPKIVRIAGEKGQVDFIRINQPELQADGTVRFINDITATKADFIVDEQDYRASMRQAMFDSLNEMIGKVMQVAPQFGISLLDLLVDLADFPGKEAMVERVKTLIAEHRGETKTPEQAAAEAEAMELEMSEKAAKIAKDQAAANKADAEADQIRMTIPATAVAMDLENVSQAQAVTGQAPMQPAEQAQLAAKGVPNAGTAAPTPGMQPVNAGSTPAPSSQFANPEGVDPTSVAIQPETQQMLAAPPAQPGAPALAPAAASSSGAGQVAPDPMTSVIAKALTQITTENQQVPALINAMATALQQISAESQQTREMVSSSIEEVAASMQAVAASVQQVAAVAQEAQRASAEAVNAGKTASEAVAAISATVDAVSAQMERVSSMAEEAKQANEQVTSTLAELKKPRTKVVEFTNSQGKKVRATIKG